MSNIACHSPQDLLQLKLEHQPSTMAGNERETRPHRDAINIEETRDFMPQMGPGGLCGDRRRAKQPDIVKRIPMPGQMRRYVASVPGRYRRADLDKPRDRIILGRSEQQHASRPYLCGRVTDSALRPRRNEQCRIPRWPRLCGGALLHRSVGCGRSLVNGLNQVNSSTPTSTAFWQCAGHAASPGCGSLHGSNNATVISAARGGSRVI
jgi:hypothetical protein